MRRKWREYRGLVDQPLDQQPHSLFKPHTQRVFLPVLTTGNKKQKRVDEMDVPPFPVEVSDWVSLVQKGRYWETGGELTMGVRREGTACLQNTHTSHQTHTPSSNSHLTLIYSHLTLI